MNLFVFPYINPVAFSLGPLKVHWYGLMYLLAFLSAWLLARFRVKRYHLDWSADQIADLIFFAAMGAIIGGRLGYMLFYNLKQFLSEPWIIFKLWQGGMSFHGGLLGVMLAIVFFSRKSKKGFLEIADFVVPLVPIGLALGRIGNFINGELWGRVTEVPWAMVYPHVDAQPRHPSQVYEFALEGVLLFAVIWIYAAKPRRAGAVSGVFLMGYGLCRFVAEFFRQPDAHLGFIAFDWLTMGQLLSIPMFIAGFILWWVRR